ncbi:type VI secretion system tip protein VgrG [Vibrio scophthalmi]|uniref:Actin cross-linking toxin VgrG1 n=1 Tax=Vibrio scophthalmi TaxID=45658 RepID=A0A1E3WNL6_9VIBR|nr:type VI secretion system tip protein VgrG [Vibrio scophthalmi]ODS10572.1 Actin cross-linking toxin VgrG1 [Vibrio scophthalmi]
MTTLLFTLTVDGLPEESFVVVGYTGKESLSESTFDASHACYGFRYDIALSSRRSGITAEQVVDKNAQLTVIRNGEVAQTVHGIVRQFTQGEIGHHHTRYALVLVPAIERLSLRQNSRIFQRKTIQDIIALLMAEMTVVDVRFDVSRILAQREFCVQYRETDLAFIHRLAAEEGLTYYIEQIPGKHTVVFVDDSAVLPQYPTPVVHNGLSGGDADVPSIAQFQRVLQIEPSHITLKERSFKKPSYGFLHEQLGAELSFQQGRYEHYDFPGRYKDDDQGKALTQIRLEYLRREAHVAHGKSDHPGLQAGVKFELSDSLDATINRRWVVVEVNHQGTQPQALEESGGDGATTYSNQFKVIPSNLTWRATPQPRPQVDGPMVGVVVGPAGEEIFCDEHGRVKVHFPWDRDSNENEHSSCWVRVSQGWAGGQYGMMAIPRIGHEVIVSFLHGDPDQPIITGRTYHATNTPPYSLPEHKTKTVMRSRTHQGEGFNELSFEDQSGQEKIFLHAQKDYEADVLNDHIAHIKHDKHLTVDNDSFTQVSNNQHVVVSGESRTQITKDHSLVVDGSTHQKTGSLYALESGNEVHIKSGAKVVIEAGAELTLKVGSSFVKVDAAGVHLVGAAINLNSGGAPGSGSGFAGQVAALPLGVEAPTPPPNSIKQQLSIPTFIALSLSNTPIAKQCQRQDDGSCAREDCSCE